MREFCEKGGTQISVGLWHFAPEVKALVAQKAGLSPEIYGFGLIVLLGQNSAQN